jgi:inosine-uridine nucleoside N-ribohydrolase
MAGSFWSGVNDGLEWNVVLDPHAAEIVYRADLPIHRSIGLDVTTQVTMQADEVRRRFQTGLLRPVLDFAEVWFKDRPVITFHDPLAATTIFDASICQFTRGQVTIELEDQPTRGKTHWQAGEGKHEVATGVYANRFFDHYFGVLG